MTDSNPITDEEWEALVIWPTIKRTDESFQRDIDAVMRMRRYWWRIEDETKTLQAL